MGFSIFSKKNVSKGQKFNVFFGGSDDVPDKDDKVDIFREDGRWAGWGKVTKNYDDNEGFFTKLWGGRETCLSDDYREIEVKG